MIKQLWRGLLLLALKATSSQTLKRVVWQMGLAILVYCGGPFDASPDSVGNVYAHPISSCRNYRWTTSPTMSASRNSHTHHNRFSKAASATEVCQIIPPIFGPLECDLSTVIIVFPDCPELMRCIDRCTSDAEDDVRSLQNTVEANIVQGCLACCFLEDPVLAATCCAAVIATQINFFQSECRRIQLDMDLCIERCSCGE